MPDLVKLGLLDEDEKKKKQEKALPPVVKPGQVNKSASPAPAASSAAPKKNADPVFLGYRAEYDAPRKVVHDLDGMNDRQAIGIAQRIVGDEARDDFLTTYRSQFTSKKSDNYRPNMPTLAQMRKTVDASVKGGVYSETRAAYEKQRMDTIAAYEQQRIAQGQNIATLNSLGVTDFGGNQVDWNTIGFEDAIRMVRLIPDESTRKTALGTLKEMTKDGGRFAKHSAYDFGTSANPYIASTDFDKAAYDAFFEGGEFTRGVEGSFSASGGNSEENRAKYEEYRAQIEEKDLSDWEKQWYIRRLDEVYKTATGTAYKPENAPQITLEAAPEPVQAAAAEPVQEAAPETEKEAMPQEEKPSASVWSVFDSWKRKPQETQDVIPQPSIRQMPSPSPTPEPVEGEDYAVVGKYASATMSSGGRWIDSRLDEAQETMETPGPMQPPMQAQEPEAAMPYGSVHLPDDPVRAAEYVLSGLGNELDQQTQESVNALRESSTAANAILGGWHYDIQRLAYDPGVEGQRYQNMGNTGLYGEDDISYIIGGRLGGYYNKTRSDSFPTELTSDVIGMILETALEAEDAYENGEISGYDPYTETLYDAYLRENPQALANLDVVFRSIYEMQKEKREYERLVSDAAEADKQAQISSAQAAVRSGSYTPEQYAIVVENAPVVTIMDAADDPMWSDYKGEISAFVRESYGDPESWIGREVSAYMEASGLSNRESNAALDYRDMLGGYIEEQMINDLRAAKALGYDTLDAYYAKQGGFSVERLADRAKIALQEFDAQIDEETLGTVTAYAGGNDSTFEAIVGGTTTGVLDTSADYLEAIWTLDNGRKEDRPLFEQRMREKYTREYGISLAPYMYRQDMLEFAQAHPSAEMGSYIQQYIDSGADVFRLAIEPEMTWSLEKAAEWNRKAQSLRDWAQTNLTPEAGKTFERSESAGSSALMQTVATMTTIATGSSSIGVAVGFGLPTMQDETEAQLADGKSLKYASTMGMAKAATTILAESATSGKLTDKILRMTGVTQLAEMAGSVVTRSKTVNAMIGLLKESSGQLFDELVLDEIKEGLGWQAIGSFTESMLTTSELVTSILASVRSIDAGAVASDVTANMTEGFWTMLPNIFISGVSGAMDGWKATRQAAQKVAQTGSTEAAREFVQSFAQDVQSAENRAELDEIGEAAALGTEAAGIMMTDPEVVPVVEAAMAAQEQANAHAQEAQSSQARMDADAQVVQDVQDRMNAGEINPDLPAMMGSAAADYSKAKQGLNEHTREEAQKRAEADRQMGDAFHSAKTKAGQNSQVTRMQIVQEMSNLAIQTAERAKQAEISRIQQRISDLDAQAQAEFDKGDDADFGLIENLTAQSGALSAYLEDMQAQEDGTADAESIRADVEMRLDEIEQQREARVAPETQAVLETRETTRRLTQEQDDLKDVFRKLHSDSIYVDETQAAEIMYELGAKSLSEVNRMLGTKLTKTPGKGTSLDGSYYAELKDMAPGYFRDDWDAHPETAIVALAQRQKILRSDISQSKQSEKDAVAAYNAKAMERYSGVTQKAAEIPPGYALSQFENENIQTSEVSTEATNELLAGTTHEIHTHKVLEEAASRRIAENGVKGTVADLMKLKSMSDEDIATGRECLAILKRNGDLVRHAMLSAKLGIEATKTGQALNVFSLFQKRSAENAAAETLEIAEAYNKKKGRYAQKMDEAAMDAQLSLGETQYQPFIEQRVSFGTADPAMQKLSSDVMQRSGLQVLWATLPDDMRGFFIREKGVIVLNQKVGASQGAYITAIHEYTHFMETAENYGEYADAVLKAAYGKDYKTSKAMLEDAGAIRDAYAGRGEELTEDLLNKELVAAATEKVLLGDEAFMRSLFASGNGGIAARMLKSMDRFLRRRKANSKEAQQEYELIEAARAKMENAISSAGKWKAEAQNGPQYSMQVERQITPGGDRQQAISDPDTYDQITASAPDGEIVMQEQPDVTQTEIRDPAEYDAKEVTRRVIANIEAMQADDVNADNEWNVPLNQFQRDMIDEYGLHGVTLPGLAYNRATIKQRMLCAILATPQDRIGPNRQTLTEQLNDLKSGRLAVVTEADYNYILSQAAIVEGSAVDEAGVPLSREGEQAFGRMKDAQANIQPASMSEKFSAWRYINLLSSPVTTIKNIDGNLLIQEAERISTIGAAWLDKQIAKKTGTRTTDVATKSEKKAGTEAAIQRGRNTFDDYFVAQTSTSRSRNYNAGGDGRVFQNNALETVRNIINFAMDAPDQMFMEKAIAEEMAILERIEAKIRDEETGELRRMTEGEIYEEAYRRASERFYHDNNRMVEIMNNLYNIPGVGTAVRVLIPFAKTPSNVALRMFDYSPLGLAKSILYDGLYAMNHAKGENGVGVGFDQRRFVMGMSRGMTGTMVTIAGALLFNSGIISFGREEEENKKRRDVLSNLGEPYSMYINIGGTKHEIAFSMPAMAGLAVGAGIADRVKDQESLYNITMGVVSDQVNQLFDNSYLSSINDIFRGYGEGSDIFFNTLNTMAESYTTQMLSPSALRAFAKAADPYARDTTSSSGLRQMINESVIQNWPLIRQTLPIRYDLTGDAMTQHKAYGKGGVWENAAMHWIDSLLSPTATYSDKDDPALWELLDLSYRVNSTGVLPADLVSGQYLSITKTDAKTLGIPLTSIQLTDDQKRWVNQQYGYILFNGVKGDAKLKDIVGLREIIASDAWAEMDDKTREKQVEDCIKKAKLYIKAKTYEAYGKE